MYICMYIFAREENIEKSINFGKQKKKKKTREL